MFTTSSYLHPSSYTPHLLSFPTRRSSDLPTAPPSRLLRVRLLPLFIFIDDLLRLKRLIPATLETSDIHDVANCLFCQAPVFPDFTESRCHRGIWPAREPLPR